MLGCLGLVKRRNTLKKIDQPTPWLTYSPIQDYKMEYVIRTQIAFCFHIDDSMAK
jgi:hypothetical protein